MTEIAFRFSSLTSGLKNVSRFYITFTFVFLFCFVFASLQTICDVNTGLVYYYTSNLVQYKA